LNYYFLVANKQHMPIPTKGLTIQELYDMQAVVTESSTEQFRYLQNSS